MMNRLLRILALLACVAPVARFAAGHDGPHKIMGTVASVQAQRIEVTTTERKATSVVTDDKTRVVHDKMTMKVTDVNPGDRVVITALEKKDAAGKLILVATEIRLGVSAPKPKKLS